MNTGNIHNQESNHIYNSETPQIHRKKKITKPPNWQRTETQIHRRNNSNKYMKYVEPQ